jgi:hypothetical protein
MRQFCPGAAMVVILARFDRLWMLPGLFGVETKSARAISLELVAQVCSSATVSVLSLLIASCELTPAPLGSLKQVRNPNSRLRTASPYLVRNVEVVTEDASINELPQHECDDSSGKQENESLTARPRVFRNSSLRDLTSQARWRSR